MYIPPGFRSVTPYFFVADAEQFVAFLVNGLDGREILRSKRPDGKIANAQVLLGDSTVMGTFEVFAMLVLGGGIVLLAPNLYQISQRSKLALVTLSFAFVFQKILFAGDVSPFLYFQF